uniref:Innexin n=2 Tax=Biomphalaria glabrata TaxID=6526 RepID=A0A2C9JXX0_BIOGL
MVLPGIPSMDSLINRAANVVLKPPIKNDDFVDRLHYFVTVAILTCFVVGTGLQVGDDQTYNLTCFVVGTGLQVGNNQTYILTRFVVGTKLQVGNDQTYYLTCLVVGTGLQEYVGSPINCWPPKDYHYDSYHDHINSYCWTHSLRYPKYETETAVNQTRGGGFLDLTQPQPILGFGTTFYRWVTLVFIVQACLFKIPQFIWTNLSGSSSADIKKIRDLVLQSQNATTPADRKLKLDETVAYFEDWITGHKSYRFRLIGKHTSKVLTVLFCLGKKSGSYLSSLYLCYKIMNIVNVFGNIFLLTVFLDLNYWKYGLVVLNSVINSGDWQDPFNFPRVLLCDFVVEGSSESASGSPVVFQIQCSMTLNQLLVKVFVLEWFWLVFLLFITIVNLVLWSVRIKPPCSTIFFIKSYIKTVDSYPMLDIGIATMIAGTKTQFAQKNLQRDFIEKYLRSDGVFILRFLELNSDRALVADIVKTLWNRYHVMQKSAVSSNMTLNTEMTKYGSSVELDITKTNATVDDVTDGSNEEITKDVEDKNVEL